MTWLAPWAWAGALLVVGPVLIHLLGRGNAPRVRFPSLRFLDASPLLPTRWSRLRDPLLLLLRVAIVLAAAAALARPLVGPPTGATRSRIVRAIIVDTSASVAPEARAAAEREAAGLGDGTATHRIFRTALPTGAIGAASAWLDAQPGTRELAVVSDFQRGAMDFGALQLVPHVTGIKLVRVGTAPRPAEVTGRGMVDGREIAVRSSTTDSSTSATWTFGAAAAAPVIEFVPSVRDADIAAQAADAIASPTSDGAHRIVIVTPAGAQEPIVRSARTLRTPWMLDAVLRMRRDPLVRSEASVAVSSVVLDSTMPAVHHDAAGRASAVALEETGAAAPRLVILLRDTPSLTDRAAWTAAARRALADAPAWREAEPARESDAALAAAQRTPAPELDRSPDPDRNDGRWLWLVALLLLGGEWWLRERMKAATAGAHGTG